MRVCVCVADFTPPVSVLHVNHRQRGARPDGTPNSCRFCVLIGCLPELHRLFAPTVALLRSGIVQIIIPLLTRHSSYRVPETMQYDTRRPVVLSALPHLADQAVKIYKTDRNNQLKTKRLINKTDK